MHDFQNNWKVKKFKILLYDFPRFFKARQKYSACFFCYSIFKILGTSKLSIKIRNYTLGDKK